MKLTGNVHLQPKDSDTTQFLVKIKDVLGDRQLAGHGVNQAVTWIQEQQNGKR